MADSYPRYKRNYEQNDPFRSEYRPGHEPSAPPYYEQERFHPGAGPPPPPAPRPPNDLDEFPHPRHGEDHPREPYFGQPEESETLGGYLFTRMIRPLWRGSHTVLRIDLRRSLAYDGPGLGKGRRNRSGPAGTVASSGGPSYADDEQGSRGWLNGLSGGGARLKLMQVWDAPYELLGEQARRWNLNIGFGLNLELDKGHVQPKFRIRARHVALHLLPQPEVELRGKWPLGGTRLAINAKYRIPLTMGLEDLWAGSGARLMVNFFNPLGSGFHLTPGGVEFDEHLIRLGEHTKLRFAAALEFPRKLPLEEGEQPVKVRVHRLGVKTVIQPGVTV